MPIHDNFRRFSVPRSLLIVAVFSFTHIKLIHRHGCPPVDQTFQRIDSAIETGIQHLELFSRERLQHIVRRILTRCRSANPYLEPDKLRRPQRLDDRFDAVVPTMTTGLLDPEASRFKVEIVMDENKVVSGEHEFSEQAFERRTSDVHPVEGTGEFEEF